MNESAPPEWAEKTGNQVEYVSRPNSSSQTLSLFDRYCAGAKYSQTAIYKFLSL
jgi:hypothetical protein